MFFIKTLPFFFRKNLLTPGTLKKSFDLGSKVISSEIDKKIVNEGIKHAPDLYNYGIKKVKNKNLIKNKSFFFYAFCVNGLKSFMIQDDKKTIEKILFGTEQLTRTGNKITLVNIKFSLNTCKHLSKNELDNLSDTAREICLLCSVF